MGLDKDGICIYIKAKDELALEARKLARRDGGQRAKGRRKGRRFAPSGTRLRRQRQGWGRCLGSLTALFIF